MSSKILMLEKFLGSLHCFRSHWDIHLFFFSEHRKFYRGQTFYRPGRSFSTYSFYSCKLSGAILRCSWFFTIQRIWIVLGRCLLRSVHTFLWFLKSNWSSDFGHAETGSGAKKASGFCGVKIFPSNFKIEWENGLWTKVRFLVSGFLFTCGNFTLIFTVFRFFWIDVF